MSEESVWALPPVQDYCTDREDAVRYPYSHAERALSDRCPFHYNRPERRGILPAKVDLKWRDWGMYRERYVRAIDEENADYFMNLMLECVTLTVPPYKPEPVQVVTVETSACWYPSDRFLVFVGILAVVFAVTAFLGILL